MTLRRGRVPGAAALLLALRFLGVAIDTAQVVGGKFWTPGGGVDGVGGSTRVPPYDFARPKLRELARALGPSRLRIGGT